MEVHLRKAEEAVENNFEDHHRVAEEEEEEVHHSDLAEEEMHNVGALRQVGSQQGTVDNHQGEDHSLVEELHKEDVGGERRSHMAAAAAEEGNYIPYILVEETEVLRCMPCCMMFVWGVRGYVMTKVGSSV